MASQDVLDKEDKLWGAKREKIFIDILLEEVNKGTITKGSISKTVWVDIHKETNKLTNKNYSVAQVKQKFNRLRTKHRLFSQLLNDYTGFGWNTETNTVTALEEQWQRVIRVNKDYAQFKQKGCEHYKLLGIIFNKSTATGILHYASTQDPPNTDDENDLEEAYLSSGVHVDVDLTFPNDLDMLNTQGASIESHKKVGSNEKRRKIDNRSNQMGEALLAWAEASRARTEASMKKAELYEREKGKSVEVINGITELGFTIGQCIEALDEIDDLEEEIFCKAVLWFKDPDNRECFMKCPDKMKKALLSFIK